MDKLLKIRKNLQKIEKIIEAIKNDLDGLIDENRNQMLNKTKQKIHYDSEELKKEHEKLYEAFKNKNIKAIEEFINAKNRDYLKAFCKVNNLPIDFSKMSKRKLIEQITRWFSQRSILTKKVI